MKIKNYLILNLVLIAFTLAPLAGKLDAQTLLLEYKFNGSGTTALNTAGTISGGDMTFYDTTGAAANLYGATGSGVSGAAGDLAFNNTASTGMGTTGTGGRAQTSYNAGIQTLTSFTLTGWFKTDSTSSIGGNATLINNLNGTNGFHLFSSASGVLALNVDGTSVTSTGTTAYAGTQQWVFFAVTYDSTTSVAKFYVGDTAGNLSLNVSRTLNAGATNDNSGSISMANLAGTSIRPFDGYLDDMRVFGATSGSLGALDMTAIQGIMTGDISNIPEPSSAAAFIAGGSAFIAGFIKLRRRNFCANL
ncbi:MAG: LamG-like jellyroll fold domain-containing protein [Opitutaceae bacterium]|jgi:hypothetical protein